MYLPSEKHPPSPITGRSPKPLDGEAGDLAMEEEADLAISDDVFRSPTVTIPPRPHFKEPPKDVFKDLNPPPDEVKEVEAKKKKKNPLEKRSVAPLQQFKRTIRPQTAMTASTATDHAQAESPATMESVDSMEFGKVHNTAINPDFRRNKLHGVLDSAYKHSRLNWLDWVDRVGPRAIIGITLLLITGGFVAWRYFGAFGGEAATTQTEQEAKGIGADERVLRGKAAVQLLLSAQTIPARLPLVMDPERAGPRMKEFYETMQGQDPKITTWDVGTPIGSENGDWLPFIFTDAAGRKVTVPLGETATGCIVDWENFTAYGDMAWPEFCRAKPTVPKNLRVRLRLVEKYGGTYTKEAWQSYEIEHRSGGPVLTAYASRTGRDAQTLQNLIKGEAWQCALLYLRWDAGVPVIEGIIRTRWQDEATSWTGP